MRQLKYHLLAIVILGVLSTQSSWADEPGLSSNEPGTAAAKTGGANQGADSASGNTIKGNSAAADDGKGPKGEHSANPKGGMNADPKDMIRDDVKGTSGHGAHAGANDTGAGINPIDTRNSVQSHRTIKRPHTIGGVMSIVRPGAPSTLRALHQNSAPGAIGGVTRNAIGVPVRNSPDVQRTNAARQGSGVQNSAPSAIGEVAGSTIGSPANAGSRVNEPIAVHQNTSARSITTTINYATVNGTGMVRPGSGPGIVGGPAKNSTGINGTGIRPKH